MLQSFNDPDRYWMCRSGGCVRRCVLGCCGVLVSCSATAMCKVEDRGGRVAKMEDEAGGVGRMGRGQWADRGFGGDVRTSMAERV